MLILLFFCLLTLYFYYQDNKGEVLFCLMAIVSNCFNFIDPGKVPVKPFDFVIIFTLLASIVGCLQNRNYFKLSYVKFVNTRINGFKLKFRHEKDWIGIVVLAIVLYLLLLFIGTILFRIDSPGNALKVVRPYSVFLLYFYLRTFKLSDFRRFLNLILIASIIQGLFFYLQLVGIKVLSGRVDEAEGVGEITRYANFPTMSSFFLIYYLLNEKEITIYRIFYVLFFGTMILIGQMRGAFFSLAAVFVVFFLLKRKIKYVGYIIVGVVVYQLAISPMFEYRERNSSTSTVMEVVSVVTHPTNVYKNYIGQVQDGTLSFRIAMLTERVIFMVNNPQYLPFGVGCIHEESEANQFFFILGTHNEMYKNGYAMLSSADSAWVGILMRFGLVGFMLFFLLLFAWARTGIPLVNKSHNNLLIVSSLLVVSYILGSFTNENLSRVPGIIMLTFYFAVIYVFRKNIIIQSNRLFN